MEAKKIEIEKSSATTNMHPDFSVGTMIIATLNPEVGLVFATDSRMSLIDPKTQKVTVLLDNLRKFRIFHPYVVMFSGDGNFATSILENIALNFRDEIPSTLKDFNEKCFLKAFQECTKSFTDKMRRKYANSFILASVRLDKNSFADKSMIKYRRFHPPEYVNFAAIGVGTKELVDFGEMVWDSVLDVENDIIRRMAGVFYCLDTCGGPIELLTVLVKTNGNQENTEADLDERHILQLPETLCSDRGIQYLVADKYYKVDASNKFVKDSNGNPVKKPGALISNRMYQFDEETMLTRRSVLSRKEGVAYPFSVIYKICIS